MSEKRLSPFREKYIEGLRQRIRSGEIPFELFLMFLEDPGSVLEEVDDLQVVWKIVEQVSLQDRAVILWYIALVTGDERALPATQQNLEAGATLHPDCREEIGKFSVRTLLLFGKADAAVTVARAIPVVKGRFKAFTDIYRNTQRPEHLGELQGIVDGMTGIPQVHTLTELAVMLGSTGHLEQAASRLRALSRDPYAEYPLLCASQTRAKIRCGAVREARSDLGHLGDIPARLVVLASLVEATKDDQDVIALTRAEPSDNTRRNLDCVDALLGAGQASSARTFATAHPHPAMQCALLSRIMYQAPHNFGLESDFLQAEEAYRRITGANPWLGEALLHFAYALTRRGHPRGARKIAARISQLRTRAKAFLGIYVNKDRSAFSDPFTAERD